MSEKFQNLDDLDKAIRRLANLLYVRSPKEWIQNIRLSETSPSLDEVIISLAELLSARSPKDRVQYIRSLEKEVFVKLLTLRSYVAKMVLRLLGSDPIYQNLTSEVQKKVDHLYALIQCFKEVVQERVEAAREEKPIMST